MPSGVRGFGGFRCLDIRGQSKNSSVNFKISDIYTLTEDAQGNTIQGLSGASVHIQLLRQARNITQARLAELVGVSARVYNRWEKGGNVPHFDTIVKLADILQVSLDELAGPPSVRLVVTLPRKDFNTVREGANRGRHELPV